MKAALSDLAASRRQTQLDADQHRPWRAEKTGAVRKVFDLLRDRPLTD